MSVYIGAQTNTLFANYLHANAISNHREPTYGLWEHWTVLVSYSKSIAPKKKPDEFKSLSSARDRECVWFSANYHRWCLKLNTISRVQILNNEDCVVFTLPRRRGICRFGLTNNTGQIQTTRTRLIWIDDFSIFSIENPIRKNLK